MKAMPTLVVLCVLPGLLLLSCTEEDGRYSRYVGMGSLVEYDFPPL
jgi:hypothetical protein